MNSDRKRHGEFLVNFHNDFLMANNNRPTSFTKDFSLLLNCRKERGKVKDVVLNEEEEDGGGLISLKEK